MLRDCILINVVILTHRYFHNGGENVFETVSSGECGQATASCRSFFAAAAQDKLDSMHTLVRVRLLCESIDATDLEAVRNILRVKRTVVIGLREGVSFRVIRVVELDVIDVGSTGARISSGRDFRDSQVLHVVSDQRIFSRVASIKDVSLDAIFEDELNATERAISFAGFNLLQFDWLELIFSF